ncbi:MAG: hypothetical protein FWB90_04475 [Fibromonadales bacterium]|nr:hypothetical protein [Fibromonadales bacterium]
MKILAISFCSLLGVLFLSCSNDDIKPPPASNSENVYCWEGDDICHYISEKSCSIIGGEPRDKECIIFNCKWTPEEVTYGQTATPTLTHDYGENCTGEMHYGTTKFTLDSTRTIAGGVFSNEDADFVVQGVLKCTNTETAQESSKNCQPLKIKKTPPPSKTGSIAFAHDYKSGDSTYFYINANARSKVTGKVEISNPVLASCNSDTARIVIEGTTTAAGNIVKAFAVATCSGVEFKLDSAVAYVLPNIQISPCDFTGNSKNTMRSTETLTVGITVSNSYGRCDTAGIRYNFTGNTWQSSSSFALSESGNQTINNARARVTCNGADSTKTCPVVTVASYEKVSGCTDGKSLTFNGNTIVSFGCNGDDGGPKYDYYISCDGNRFNFTIEIEGYVEGNNGNNIRPNPDDNGYNLPDLRTEAVLEDGLYWYPKEIVVKTTQPRLTCGMW